MKKLSKYNNLISGCVALFGSTMIFLFFIKIDVDLAHTNKISLYIKPGYESWTWGLLFISSSLYYFIRSNGESFSGGYINPVLKILIKIAQIIPFIGLLLSLANNNVTLIFDNNIFDGIMTAASTFLNSIIILFIVAHFGAGLSNIKAFFGKNSTH